MRQVHCIEHAASRYLGTVRINTNHDSGLIEDATWHPYPLGGDYYNTTGKNGYFTGKVVKGGTTSRLFQHSVTRDWKPGDEVTYHYATINDKLRPARQYEIDDGYVNAGDWVFESFTCG